MKKIEFFLAWRFFVTKKGESFISVVSVFSFIGIMLGVMALVMMSSIMEGTERELISIGVGIHGDFGIERDNGILNNPEIIIKNTEKLNNIDNAHCLISREVLCMADDAIKGGVGNGITADDMKNKKKFIFDTIEGNKKHEIEDETGDWIILGKEFAARLKVKIGDPVTMIVPVFNEIAVGSIPRTKTFTVFGIFSTGNNEFDTYNAFVSLSMMQRIFRMGNAVDTVEIFIKNHDLYEKTRSDIKNALSKNIINVKGWERMGGGIVAAIKVQKNMFFAVLSIIILIASFNIISAMIMTIKDKEENIAILRTIGATKRSIVRIFLIVGSINGVVGTIFGVIFGIFGANNIDKFRIYLQNTFDIDLIPPGLYMLNKLPTYTKIDDVIFISVISLSLSILATVYPAIKASKTDPAKILR